MTAGLRQIFIGGTGRSGTTVLGQTLASHPEVVGINQELRIHVDPGGALDLVHALGRNWSPYVADAGIQAFLGAVGDSRRARLWNLPIARWGGRSVAPRRYATLKFDADFGRATLDEALEELIASLTTGVSRSRWTGTHSYRVKPTFFETPGPVDGRSHLRRFFDHLYQGRARRLSKSATVWVDHTPFNSLHQVGLARLFPEALFVTILRDPQDVFDSYMEQDWASDSPLLTARRLLAVLRVAEGQWGAVGPHRTVRLRLEDLARSPTETVEALLAKVGLELEPRTLRVALSISEEAASRNRRGLTSRVSSDRAVNEVLDECRAVCGY